MKWTLHIIAATLLAGCGGGDSTENVALRRLPVETYAEWPVREYVVRSQSEWEAVFAEVRSVAAEYPVPQPPTVDFARDAVIGVSTGWVMCMVPRIRSVTRQGIDYTIEYGSDARPEDMCAAVSVPGTDFVLVPQPVGRVTFVHKDR